LTTPYSNHSPKQTTKNAATTVINDLLSWLKETLLRGAKYIPVKSGKWLKAKAGEYSWAETSQVPRKAKQEYGQLSEENDDGSQSTSGESATWDIDSETRKTRLKKANSLQAARLLSDNSRMLATAKAEPSVVDCDTAVGVELKAAAYPGNLDSVAGKYDVSPSQVGDIIGTELAARAGYNTFGDSLPGEIGNAEADAEAESGGESGDGSGKGNGSNPQSGRPNPGTDSSHIPTSGSSDSGSGSGGGRPSPGSKGSHIPTASGSNAGDTGSSSGSGSGSAGSAGNSGGAGTGTGGSGSGSPGAGES